VGLLRIGQNGSPSHKAFRDSEQCPGRGGCFPGAEGVLLLCYRHVMAVRQKRSISVSPELDARIRSEAAREGMTYSAWLSEAARKELTIRAGLDAVAEVEGELGPFSAEELADAQEWAKRAIRRNRPATGRQRRMA
jgi:hypothetical protein